MNSAVKNAPINAAMPVIAESGMPIAVTSITVVALAFGLDSILSFSIPLMFGIISGFYTSTCLTAPLWVGLRNQLAKARARRAEKKLAK